MLLAQAETVARAIPYESIGVVGLLIIGILAVWRVNTKLAQKNEALNEAAVARAEATAVEKAAWAERVTQVLEANTQALNRSADSTDRQAKAFEENTRLVERALNRLGAD